MTGLRRCVRCACAVIVAVATVQGGAATARAASPAQAEHAQLIGATALGQSTGTDAATPASVSGESQPGTVLPNDRPARALVRPATGAPIVRGARLSGAGDVRTASGLNAHDNALSHTVNGRHLSTEPPDQALCVGSDRVMEIVNLVIRIYDRDLRPISDARALEPFFHLPLAFGLGRGHLVAPGDPKCLRDEATGRWYVSLSEFDLTAGKSFLMLAVSQTDDPTGGFNLYSLNTTQRGDPGCPCTADQPLLGANGDAVFVSTNELPVGTPTPLTNGANVYVWDKRALARGDVAPNVAIERLGLTLDTPDGSCAESHGTFCWSSVQPATDLPAEQQTRAGGTEYALSGLDFRHSIDHRIALWAFTNTRSIGSAVPDIGVREVTLPSETYGFPPNAAQAAGPAPLRDCVIASGCGLFAAGTAVPEGPIATNDDRMNQVTSGDRLLWAGVNTVVDVAGSRRAGIAYFAVRPTLGENGLSGRIARQGYVAVAGEDVVFPSFATDADGRTLATFTLTGPDLFPSTAYTFVGGRDAELVVHVADRGQAPQDGFTEYEAFGMSRFSPHWGDYSAAVGAGRRIYFATEFIPSPACPDPVWNADPTCGGTRDRIANWGTSLNVVGDDEGLDRT